MWAVRAGGLFCDFVQKRGFVPIRLTEILKPENIKSPLVAADKNEAIEKLIQLLHQNGELVNVDRVRKAVFEREQTRTTGIGDGLAIPHGKSDGVIHLVMAVGRADSPIEFQSIDGKPVSLIWLLASPTDKTVLHINALARISKIMAQAPVRRQLLGATTAREMYDIIAAQDELL